jgi:hypothetical protein
MFFWIALPVVLLIALAWFAWAARGVQDPEHKPRTQPQR